jgi:hypothetical protein
MHTRDEVLQLIGCYMKSRAVLTAAELDVFGALEQAPLSAEPLACRLGADRRALTRLLDSLVALGLLAREEEKYALTEPGALLASGSAETLRPMALHMNTIWKNWGNLTAAVRKGTNPMLQPVIGENNLQELDSFIGAMHAIGGESARNLAAAYDAGSRTRLLDVGGALGTYTTAFLDRYSGLQATLFDFPAVIDRARKALASSPHRDRIAFAAGDFYRDPLPPGSDLVLLSAIIHQNSPEENLDLFQKVFSCLVPGGSVLIRDHIMDESRTKPPAGALFALNMLVNTPAGDTYTFSEVRRMLLEAGFEMVELLRRGDAMDCLVEARKPS